MSPTHPDWPSLNISLGTMDVAIFIAFLSISCHQNLNLLVDISSDINCYRVPLLEKVLPLSPSATSERHERGEEVAGGWTLVVTLPGRDLLMSFRIIPTSKDS